MKKDAIIVVSENTTGIARKIQTLLPDSEIYSQKELEGCMVIKSYAEQRHSAAKRGDLHTKAEAREAPHEEVGDESRREDRDHSREVRAEHHALADRADIKGKLLGDERRRPAHAGVRGEYQGDVPSTGAKRGGVAEKRLHSLRHALLLRCSRHASVTPEHRRKRNADENSRASEEEVDPPPRPKLRENHGDKRTRNEHSRVHRPLMKRKSRRARGLVLVGHQRVCGRPVECLHRSAQH